MSGPTRHLTNVCQLLAIALVFQALSSLSAEPRRTISAPDGRATFTAISFPDHSELTLRIGPAIAWSETAPLVDRIPAAWSSDSRGLLLVEPADRMSLRYLAIEGTQVHEYEIATAVLTQLGARLQPYNWGLPNQGSIPHDNIFELEAGLDPGSFGGTYVRSRYPHRVTIPFNLMLSWHDGQCVPRFETKRPVETPW